MLSVVRFIVLNVDSFRLAAKPKFTFFVCPEDNVTVWVLLPVPNRDEKNPPPAVEFSDTTSISILLSFRLVNSREKLSLAFRKPGAT